MLGESLKHGVSADQWSKSVHAAGRDQIEATLKVNSRQPR